MKNDIYYYSILSREEKSYYQEIYSGLQKHQKRISIRSSIETDRAQEIYRSVLADHPLLYFVNQRIIRIQRGFGIWTLLPEYLYTEEERKKLDLELREVLKKIHEKAKPLISNPAKLELFLHDSVVRSVAYDYEALMHSDYMEAHSIIGAFLRKRAVCDGIAKAFKLLCNLYGIKCMVVTGKADSTGKFDGETWHAWNVIRLQGHSYHVDVTWDHPEGVRHKVYDYFNLTTEEIERDHQIYGKIPYCTDHQRNYFYLTKRIVRTKEEMRRVIRREILQNFFMFRAEETRELGTMKELKQIIIPMVQEEALLAGKIRKFYFSTNELQRIVRIDFSEDPGD